MVIGNEKQQDTLKALADRNQLSHGYLFFGPEGVGKRTIAFHLAQYLERKDWNGSGVLIDTLLTEPGEGGTIGIDAARSIKFHLSQTPFTSFSRITIIDNAHTLTTEAQNALLKVSEDAPDATLLIYVTHDPDALLSTLLSRLQKCYFGTVSSERMIAWLVSLKIPAAQAKKVVEQAPGLPGMAWRLIHDKKFQMWRDVVEQFEKTSEAGLPAFFKKITERDDFDLGRFLDALVILESPRVRKSKVADLWHTLLELRMNVERYNLNSKIQLRALHPHIKQGT